MMRITEHCPTCSPSERLGRTMFVDLYCMYIDGLLAGEKYRQKPFVGFVRKKHPLHGHCNPLFKHPVYGSELESLSTNIVTISWIQPIISSTVLMFSG